VRALLVVLAVAVVAAAHPHTAALRTIYITASAADGTPLPVLNNSDVIIREGDQPRPNVQVEPSRGTLRVAIVVEELLAPDNEVRRAVANFIDRIRETGQLALFTVGRRTEKRVNYSTDVLPFAAAINGFPARAVDPGDLVQALHDIAREQRQLEGRHVIVVIASQTAQVSNSTATAVLEQITAGRGVLYAATLAGSETSTIPFGQTSGGRRLELEGQVSGLERDRTFNDTTRQTGGLHLSSTRTAGLFNTLERIAVELHQQYVVSYDAGMTSDGTVKIEAGRPGITVRGPSRVR
jgi:hypothetical protein